MSSEIWRPIPNYEPYQASSLGRIRGIKGSRILTPVVTQYGYHQVSLCVDGEKYSRLVHRLVALAFLGPQPTPEHDVLHWDGDKTNNCLSNLRWGTPKDNNADQERHNTRARGSRIGVSRLNESVVRRIRIYWKVGKYPEDKLAEMYGVSRRTINSIVRRQTWKHVA
jgi:hypothetical protein